MTITKSIRVERPPATAFRVFCEEIGKWWPKGPSFRGTLANLFIEGRVGGRVYEVYTDATEFEIGRVTAYQPPSFVAFTWRAPSWDMDTMVEVRFIADGGGTRVELNHSGWERAPNILETRKNYDRGWDAILPHYSNHMKSA